MVKIYISIHINIHLVDFIKNILPKRLILLLINTFTY